ncbi:DUF1501 domain-containing protein [Paraburkholderia caribensis]|jgi:uncharacterized protein (DUF1501 family)|uniref:DUF1501 domain-containing protein n=1 Tax=Paraburkholderia caribensis TaxID=75105 RepID=A0A9Q6RY76_9BURK|nr:DUF1501 domain-containing protein [Paraburkholderia caribensis]MCO4881512.1 DUF1501 domain-containing protein [Paraburkholderia caribensis]PTB25256.1 hypothetical protein C9I56_29330 [Paraburkholderia caribensis]QLB61088.1 hypothetical protein A9O66_00950 [Paraburkholderia caribensis]
MKRREFLTMAAAASASLSMPRVFAAPHTSSGISTQLDAGATGRAPGKLIVLIELKGGNDGLNTVIPFADSTYYALREHIAIPRERVLPLDERVALHPAMRALLPFWRDGEVAVVQGVGCAQDHASHFRSTEIWDTASSADVYRHDGWLTRAIGQWPASQREVAAASFGSAEPGPFAGCAARVEADDAWARVDDPDAAPHAGWLDADRGEGDRVSGVAQALRVSAPTLRDSIDAALRTVVDRFAPHMCGAIRLTLDGFDTHSNQPAQHAALLRQLAEGCATLRAELTRRGRWRDTLVVTYSEFGRSARENVHRGTGHGGGAAHFVLGGQVRGGVYGRAADLARLDTDGNLPVDIDFRQIYATVLGPFLKLDANAVLQDDVPPLPLLRT